MTNIVYFPLCVCDLNNLDKYTQFTALNKYVCKYSDNINPRYVLLIDEKLKFLKYL